VSTATHRTLLFETNEVPAKGIVSRCRGILSVTGEYRIDGVTDGVTQASKFTVARCISSAVFITLRLVYYCSALYKDVTAATSAVLEAVASGAITPGEGQAVAGLIEAQLDGSNTCPARGGAHEEPFWWR
jgi:hypothetical protein